MGNFNNKYLKNPSIFLHKILWVGWAAGVQEIKKSGANSFKSLPFSDFESLPVNCPWITRTVILRLCLMHESRYQSFKGLPKIYWSCNRSLLWQWNQCIRQAYVYDHPLHTYFAKRPFKNAKPTKRNLNAFLVYISVSVGALCPPPQTKCAGLEIPFLMKGGQACRQLDTQNVQESKFYQITVYLSIYL